MPRSRQAYALGLLALALVAFALVGVIYIGPWEAREPDDTYIALAAATPQGQAYFRRFPAVGCSVSRGRQVTVNCDTVEVEGTARYPQSFRVVIDARTNAVTNVEIQMTAR